MLMEPRHQHKLKSMQNRRQLSSPWAGNVYSIVLWNAVEGTQRVHKYDPFKLSSDGRKAPSGKKKGTESSQVFLFFVLFAHLLPHMKASFMQLQQETALQMKRYDQLCRDYQRRLLQLRAQVDTITKHHKEKYEALVRKVEWMEQTNMQQSIVADIGSYKNTGATPPLLQMAVDTVKYAITICASNFYARKKPRSVSLNLKFLMGSDEMLAAQNSGKYIEFAMQSHLCNLLFTGFEDPSSFMCPDIKVPPFEKWANRKRRFFATYKRLRYLDPLQLLHEDKGFKAFWVAKSHLLTNEFLANALLVDDMQKKNDYISLELLCGESTNPFYKSVLRLMRAVWVLHKLAFSFEPSVEIFKVAKNSVFDEEYMEDVAQLDNDESGKGLRGRKGSTSVKKVKFMCMPGFCVRNTIIKSGVFCKENEQPTGFWDVS